MKHLRIAVCDDEKVSLSVIENYLKKSFAKQGIGVDISLFQSARVMVTHMEENLYDICFVDIDMPEMNGIDFAEELRKREPQIVIVFVSAKEEYVFQSFCVHPFSFVRKTQFSKDMERVVKDIAEFVKQKKQENTKCRIRDESGYEHFFFLESICYLEAKENYVNIVLTDGTKLLRCSMKKLEKELEPYGVIRCHRSYMVNIKKVYAVKHDRVVMMDKVELPIRRGMATELKKRLCSVMVR